MSRLEVWELGHTGAVIDLGDERLTVGADTANDLVIDEAAVSRVHLRLDRVGTAWVLEDLGSRNGTFVNGTRALGPRVLRDGDEIRVGSTRLVFRSDGGRAGATAPARAIPTLTPREEECLAALCAPVLKGSSFTEPASVHEVAEALFVSDSAIKKMLGRLYDKFELHDEDRRRGRLAAEALSMGAVRLPD